MPGRRLYVDMNALLEAMDSRADPPSFVFDKLTGEILLTPYPPLAGAAPDDEQFAPIPRASGPPAPPPALPGHMDEHDQRQVHQTRLLDQALAWLSALGIDPQFELTTPRRPRPLGRPVGGVGQPAVGLFELLLLGGPAPEAEPPGGVVERRLVAASAEQARKVFVRVARELCEHHGQPWRRDLVERQGLYEVGRSRLVVEGKTVRLEVEVDAGLRALFAPGAG